MSYLVAQLVLGGALAIGSASIGRRRRKDRADLAEAEQFINDLRASS